MDGCERDGDIETEIDGDGSRLLAEGDRRDDGWFEVVGLVAAGKGSVERKDGVVGVEGLVTSIPAANPGERGEDGSARDNRDLGSSSPCAR